MILKFTATQLAKFQCVCEHKIDSKYDMNINNYLFSRPVELCNLSLVFLSMCLSETIFLFQNQNRMTHKPYLWIVFSSVCFQNKSYHFPHIFRPTII